MHLRVLGLLALPFVQVIHGVAFSSPAPTGTVTRDTLSFAPSPTPGLSVRGLGMMRRQNMYPTTTSWWTDDPEVCGWVDGNPRSQNVYSCLPSWSCVYHPSTSLTNMMGCCSSSSCVFHTICYNAADILQSRTLTETTRPFAIYCTEPEYPFCRTWVFESPHVTNFGCGPTSETINNVSDYAWWTEQGLATLHTQYLTTVGDKLVSEYAHSFSSVPTSIAMGASQALTPSSQSTRTTSTSEATAGASESTKSSTSSGAIAGGVVGGVAGGAAMVLGGIFLWRRRKQNELARTSPDTPGSGGDYQSVLGNHIGHSGMEMQSPMEVESNDPSHRYSEVPGTVTSDRAFEMHADPNAQVKAGFELDASSKDWTAELPADYHRPLN